AATPQARPRDSGQPRHHPRTRPRFDQAQRPRYRRRARRAWPHRGGEGAAGAVWGHGAGPMTALAETANRQSLWSSTASVLKRRVQLARWVTFAFSILGALLASIASQLNDAPRMYFAVAAAVLLAVVSFVTSRLLGGFQVASWTRARTASEALKREAYKYAASVAPYDDPV